VQVVVVEEQISLESQDLEELAAAEMEQLELIKTDRQVLQTLAVVVEEQAVDHQEVMEETAVQE
jgi:hypothetical protein